MWFGIKSVKTCQVNLHEAQCSCFFRKSSVDLSYIVIDFQKNFKGASMEVLLSNQF